MKPSLYLQLKWKLTATALSFSLIPLFLLGFVLHGQFSKSYEEKLRSNLRLTVLNKADAIDMFLGERVVQLQNIANTNSFADISQQEKLNGLFDAIYSTSSSFIDLGVFDQQGNHVAYCGPYDLKNINYQDQRWFNQAMLKGIYISDVFMGYRNFPHFIIAVKRREQGRTWILRATIDSDVFNTLVSSVRTGRFGDAYLINSDLLLQTSSRRSGMILAKAELPSFSAGSEVNIVRWDDHGTGMVAGIMALNMVDWSLVVLENPGEELSPVLRDQSLVFVLLFVCALMISSGTYFAITSIVRKLMLTDKEKALMDATVMQSSKMASLGKMAAGVAHEVNNPLSIIRESAGWIRDMITDGDFEGVAARPNLEEALADIERHVERARSVTHRMLGFARSMEPVQDDVDLNQLVRETVSFLDNEILYRTILVNYDLSPELPSISTDFNQVQQVVLNLMENAIDAVGNEGTISLSTRRDGDFVELEVSDTGPGIPQELLSRVFDPFFTTKAAGEGTGLGLSIIYTILKKVGGDIKARNLPEGGAQFTVRLPLVNMNVYEQEESCPE
ncbi:ATP-binding protein [Maridesulfovibrio sp.]|uniref:sensor histidine kinase n=1 Tax=Maridesulfovibrio sp. TaxID=2795000 RepID=UPI0029F5BD95|nr:ATP-binding protein [Maridesulfovibrio sp.]